MAPSKDLGSRETSSGSKIFGPQLDWSSLESEPITTTHPNLSGISQSSAQMYDQRNYSGLQSETTATSPTIIPGLGRVSQQANNNTSTPSQIPGPSRSSGQMYNQTSYGLQSQTTAINSESDEEGSQYEPSSPLPTWAEYEAMEKRRVAESDNSNSSTAIPIATASGEGQSNDRSSLLLPVSVMRSSVGASSVQDSFLPGSPTPINSPGQSDDYSSSLFLTASVTNSAQVLTNTSSPSLPLPLAVGGLPEDPASQIHSRFCPSAIHTTMCDLCNKKNTTIIQRCQDCNLQFCEKCIKANKVSGKHIARYEDLEWKNVGPGLKPVNTSQRRRRPAKNNKVSIEKRKYTPASSTLRHATSVKVTKSTSSATRKTTRATTRAATAASFRKSGTKQDDMYKDDGSDYAGSLTDVDPMDEDEVRENLKQYPQRPVGSLYGHGQYQDRGFIQGGSICDTPSFDSGFGNSMSDMRRQRPLSRPIPSSFYPLVASRMTDTGHNIASENFRVRDTQITSPATFRPPRSGFHPASNELGMGSGYSPRSGFHPPSNEFGMGSGYSPLSGYQTPSVYQTRSGFQSPFELQRPFDTHYSTHNQSTSNRSDRFNENLTEFQKVQKAAKEAEKEKSSYQSKLRGFRFEMQVTWENDPSLKQFGANNMMKKALEIFEAVVTMMSLTRGIAPDDTADIFQRVTGEEMTG